VRTDRGRLFGRVITYYLNLKETTMAKMAAAQAKKREQTDLKVPTDLSSDAVAAQNALPHA
jgi:hypothetical protein